MPMDKEKRKKMHVQALTKKQALSKRERLRDQVQNEEIIKKGGKITDAKAKKGDKLAKDALEGVAKPTLMQKREMERKALERKKKKY